jgi:hypothetical protein
LEVTVSDGSKSDTDRVNVTVQPTNSAPTADAGDDQTVDEETTVTLDGTGSSDPDGDTLSFSWTQAAGPSVTLIDSTTATPEFTAPEVDTATTLFFDLTVSDGSKSDTDSVSVTVEPTNSAPTADAGANRRVNEGTTVTLDGTRSSDPDGDSLSFSWTQTGGPSVALIDSNTATPEFTAPDVDSSTSLTFELTVSDGSKSDTDSVTITADPEAETPTADAGEDRTVDEETTVTLDGTGSSDPNGDSLSYSWTQTGGPSVTLRDSTTATPEFTTPTVDTRTTLTFELTVEDDDGNTDTDSVTITVEPTNSAPTADAGADQTVDEGTTVTLDATGSSDSDGDTLSFSWTQTGGPSVSLRDSNTATPEFTAPDVDSSTTLTFELTVSDGTASDTDTTTVTVSDTDGGTDIRAARELTTTDVLPGGGVEVTIRATFSNSHERVAILDGYTGPVAGASIESITEDGEPIPEDRISVQNADSDDLIIAFKNVSAKSTVAVTYSVSIQETASPGETIDLVGNERNPEVSAGGASAELVDDTVTVVDDPIERADTNDDGEISDKELQEAVIDWAEGKYTDEELQQIIREWARG